MEKRNLLENSASFLVKKSGQMLNIGKLKLSIANLENEVYNLKAELGDVVYQSYRDGSDGSERIEELCVKLAEKDEQLQDLKEQVEELQEK
jgi:predicted RNase H-like nuclease (RuvC/YqgF family)